jgi:hypothetical protein
MGSESVSAASLPDEAQSVSSAGQSLINHMTLLALFGHGSMSDLSPLSGEERKSNFGAARSVNDPTQTSSRVR